MAMVCPVIQEEAAPARKTAALAMSTGSPIRPSGVTSLSSSSLFSHSPWASWVRTMPGAMPLTRTFGASSAANPRVRWMTAALVAL